MPDPFLSAFPDEQLDDAAPAQKPQATPSAPADPRLSAFPIDNADRLTDSMSRRTATPADTAAEIFSLQLKTGLPSEVISRNLDDVRKQASATDFDVAAFRQKSPHLAKWLDTHPLNASVAGDDLVPLTTAEHALRLGINSIRAMGAGLMQGLNMGAWGILEAAGDVLGLPNVTAWGKVLGEDAGAMAAGIKGEQRGAGPNERAFYSGFESMGSAAPVMAASILAQNPTLALSLMGTQTGGQAYSQARAAGVSIPGALAFGTSQGAIEAATEMLPVAALFGDLAKKAGLFKTLAHQALLEVPGEQVATALQDLNEWAAINPGRPFQDYMNARPSAAVQTLIATLVATGAQSGAIHTINRAVSGMTAEKVLGDLGAATKESQLAARSPAKFTELLASITRDTPLEAVYANVDTWTKFWQDKGVDPAEMAAQAGSSKEAYAEAAESGADLRIPTAGFATAISGTDANAFWSKELKFEPGEMNARESEAFIAAHSNAVTAAAISPPPDVAALQATIVKHLVDRGRMRQQDAETNAAIVSAMLTRYIGDRAGLDARAIFEARTDPRFIERVAGPEAIGTGEQTTAEVEQTGALYQDELDALLQDPVARAALERRTTAEGQAPATGERRNNNAALRELEAETAGMDVGAGGGQQTLAALRRDPSLQARAAAFLRTSTKGAGVRAEFLAHGPDGPLFNLVGGPKHGSTVGLPSLEALGVTVPTIPADTGERLSGDELRARMLAARALPTPTKGPLFQDAPSEKTPGVDGPMFYSRIIRAVEESQLKKAPGAQWVATIKNYKGGISKAEADLLGVDTLTPVPDTQLSSREPLLPGFTTDTVYTKQQVLDILTQNVLSLEIVDLHNQEDDETDDDENEITEEDIERELENMRESRVDSEEDYYRGEWDEDAERERLRAEFNPPDSKTEFIEADPDDEDAVDHYLAYVDGDVITEYNNQTRRDEPKQFDTEEEAEDDIRERIDELMDEFVDEEYNEPDFREQAIELVDNHWDDDAMREEAIENIESEHGGRRRRSQRQNRTRYGQYVEEGPKEDYHELFITAPTVPAAALPPATVPGGQLDLNAEITLTQAIGEGGGGGFYILVNGEKWLDVRDEPIEVWHPHGYDAALEDAKEQYQRAAAYRAELAKTTSPQAAPPKWNDGHSEYNFVKNPIARLRVNTRQTPLGKTLFVEEIQPPGKYEQPKMPPLIIKNWRELGWKTALRFAAQNGHDAIAWTTGEEQAKRYQLDRVVRTITWTTDEAMPNVRLVDIQPIDHGAIRLTYDADTGGVRETSDERFADKNMSEIVGDEILAKMTEGAGNLQPKDLRVGGFGLKKLYDRDFVAVVNGLAAVKRGKGRVGETLVQVSEERTPRIQDQRAQGIAHVPGVHGTAEPGTLEYDGYWVIVRSDGSHWSSFADEATAQAELETWNAAAEKWLADQGAQPHKALAITADMRAAIMAGQPLFQALDALTTLPTVEGVLPDVTVRRLPFPSLTDAQADQLAGTREIAAPATRQTVKLSELVATQATFREDVAREKITAQDAEVPTGIRLGDQVYLTGGHHRAVAAWAQGETAIEVNVQEGDLAALPQPLTTTGRFTPPGRQMQQEKRGAISFQPETGKALISLFEKADFSTFQHEVAHLFLELIGDTVDVLKALDPAALTPNQMGVIRDYDQVLLPFLGVSNRELIGREQHERFADAWESYLMTGQAPSAELRPVFSRVKAWLLGVYRNIRRSVTLTPEVRGFMDRLLASDDAIIEAQRDARIIPIFTDAASAQMTPEQFELYRKDIERASTAAHDRLDAQIAADVAREQRSVWKAQKAEIQAQVVAEFEQDPIYRAFDAIRYGTNPDGSSIVDGTEAEPMKLNRAAVVAILGEASTKALPRPAIYTSEGGADPQQVAELFGFSSAEDMLLKLGQAPPLKMVIAKETERRMLAAHGGLLYDGTLHDKAREAVANEHRDVVIRAEIRALQALKRKVAPHVRLAEASKQANINALAGQVATMAKTARRGPGVIAAGVPSSKTIAETARARLAASPIRLIHPQLYWAAARKANDQAVAAAAQQDFDAAIHAQTQQLLNLALYRQSAQALEDVDRRVKAARELDGTNSRRRIGRAGATYQDQIDGILDRYEFAQVSARTIERRASLRKWAAAMEGEGFEVDLTDEQLDDSRRVNYRELTYDELVGVTDGLRAIVHLATLKNRLLVSADRRDFAEQRDGLVESLRLHNLTKRLPLEFRPTDESRRRLALAFASHRKVAMLARSLDGNQDGGAMWEAIIRPLNAAADAKVDRNKKEIGEYSRILEQHFPGRELARLHELMPIPAINGSLSHEARLAVALNWGTTEGRDRLTMDPTRRWSASQVEAILETLTENDWSFVRATWAFNEKFWPEIAAQQERVTGVAPERVSFVPVQTRFGTFQGGYYHLKYDGRLSPRAQQNEAASMAKLGAAAAYVRTTTKQGHVETRQQNVRLSVRFDLGVQFAHIEEVVHSLTHREMLIDVTRILRDSGVQRAIYETQGDQVYHQFTSILEDIAIGHKPATGFLDKSANFMRTGTQIAGLGWNLWTAFQQPLGLFNGMQRVGVGYVMRGMTRWLRDAAAMESTTKWIAELSPMMRNRLDTATQDLSDLRQALRRPGGWFDNLVRTVSLDTLTQQAILDGYLWHIGLAQRVADVPTWLGAYEKAMEHEADEPRAIALADQAVLDSQGGGQMKDLAQVQRGGPIAKLYMTFYSYGSTVLNSSINVVESTNYKSPASVATALGHLSLLYIMPAIGTVALARAMGKAGGDDDDWTDWLTAIGQESASSALNGVVLVRELTGLLRDGVRGYEGPAGARFLQLMYRLGGQVRQGTLDEGLWKAANAAGGIIFRYPSAQVQRTVDGFVALEEGRSKNPLVLFTGPPPRER